MDAKNEQRLDGLLPTIRIGLAIDKIIAPISHTNKGCRLRGAQPLPYGYLFVFGSGKQLMEDVVRSLPGAVADDPALFEQIGRTRTTRKQTARNRPPGYSSMPCPFYIEPEAGEFSKAG